VERLAMRRLTDAPVAVSLVVTVGLLVILFGVAQYFWPQGEARPYASLFHALDTHDISIFSVNISWNQLVTFLLAGGVAAGLYILLNRTRTGTAMRAVVDNRGLVALYGGRPSLMSSLSWAGGAGLAALAGILLTAESFLDYYNLTFLVVNAYAAAMLGKL